MSIQTLLQESFQPEQAKLVEKAITDVIEQKLNEAAVDAASKQAELAQRSAEEICDLHTHYQGELRKASLQYLDLEKRANAEIKTAVDAIVKANGEKLELVEHYQGELREAAKLYLQETDVTSINEMQATIAKYVSEKAELMEHAQAYGEHAYERGLQEAEAIAKEANEIFIQESQEMFNQLDELARARQTLNTIKESFEISGFALSEDLAYQGLQEEVQKQEAANKALQESLDQANAELLENAKLREFDTLTEGMSELQKSKLKNVASVITGDIKEYSRTLSYLVESQATPATKTVAEKTAPTGIANGLNTLNEKATSTDGFTQTKPVNESIFGGEPADFVNNIVNQIKNINTNKM